MIEHPPLADKNVVQSRSGFSLSFEFRPDDLVYNWQGPVDQLRFAAPYEHIWVRSPAYLTIDNVVFARRFFFAYVALVATLIGATLFFRLDPRLAMGALFLCLVIFVLIRMKSPFSIHFVILAASIDPASGLGREIRIFDDESGASVIDEISLRWRMRLRAMHAFVDPTNDPKVEAGKFDWLRQNEVIDEAEYRTALSELREAGLGAGPSFH